VAARTSRRGGTESAEPHSWDFDNWPESVWPNDPDRAKWVVRSNRRELMAEGALTRVGKRVVILGRGYKRWLARRADRVTEFDSNLPHLRRSAETARVGPPTEAISQVRR
jgi:hypothetical protein